MSIQTGIDGFRLIGERTGRYAPGREPTCTYDKEGRLFSATSYIKKMTDDKTWHEVAATAYWAEYAPAPYKDGNMNPFWQKMPHVMLSKCAEALALRKAFPADLSGIYTTEEMAQAKLEDDTTLDQEKPATSLEQITEDPKIDDSHLCITETRAAYLESLIGQDMFINEKVGKALKQCGYKAVTEITNERYDWFEANIMKLRAEGKK